MKNMGCNVLKSYLAPSYGNFVNDSNKTYFKKKQQRNDFTVIICNFG